MAGHDLNYLALSGVLAVSRLSTCSSVSKLNFSEDHPSARTSPNPPQQLHGRLRRRWTDLRSWGHDGAVRADRQRVRAASGIRHGSFSQNYSCHLLTPSQKVTGARYIGTGPFLRGRPDANLGPGWAEPAGHNILDGGCPFYAVYSCSDGQFITIAPLEEKFYAVFMSVPRTPHARSFTHLERQ